jgi:hypothetical protein
MRKFFITAAAVVLTALAVPALAATNPFMDVPASHWAYDAVAQLASRGVISGYPDGSYKGGQPATRYEMASIIARGLAQVDMEKASKADVELMRRLIIEFKDELDALGVRADSIDERLGVIESNLGGWKLSGEFRFDANFGMDENNDPGWYNDDMFQSGKNDFDLNYYRIFIEKRVNETTSFSARIGVQDAHAASSGGSPNMRWERYFITTQLGYDVSLTAGRVNFDWEGDAGLVASNASIFGDIDANAFVLAKSWGMANLEVVLGRYEDSAVNDGGELWEEGFLLAAKLHFDVSEKFYAGVMAYYSWADDDVPVLGVDLDSDLLTAGLYFGYNITPDVALKGLYYYQRQGDWESLPLLALTGSDDDNASAWRIAVEVGQDALKFTSLWAEYNQIDNNFYNNEAAYAFNGAALLANKPWNGNTTKVYGLIAGQEWNEKWRTYVGYYGADFDTAGVDDASNWTLGVGYRLNPAVEFELAYDNIDYGENNPVDFRNGDEHQIRVRTYVSF